MGDSGGAVLTDTNAEHLRRVRLNGHEIRRNDSHIMTVNHKFEMCINCGIHKSNQVLFPGYKRSLEPGSSTIINIRAVDKAILCRRRA